MSSAAVYKAHAVQPKPVDHSEGRAVSKFKLKHCYTVWPLKWSSTIIYLLLTDKRPVRQFSLALHVELSGPVMFKVSLCGLRYQLMKVLLAFSIWFYFLYLWHFCCIEKNALCMWRRTWKIFPITFRKVLSLWHTDAGALKTNVMCYTSTPIVQRPCGHPRRLLPAHSISLLL